MPCDFWAFFCYLTRGNHRFAVAVTALLMVCARTAERPAISASSNQSATLQRLLLCLSLPFPAALLLARLCTAHSDSLSRKALEELHLREVMEQQWRRRLLAHQATRRTRGSSLRVSKDIHLDRLTTLLHPKMPTAVDANTKKIMLRVCRLRTCTVIQIPEDARPHPPCKGRLRLNHSMTTHLQILQTTSKATGLARPAATALLRRSKATELVP